MLGSDAYYTARKIKELAPSLGFWDVYQVLLDGKSPGEWRAGIMGLIRRERHADI